MLTIASLLVVQAMTKVLSIKVKLPTAKAVGETVGEVDEQREATVSMLALPGVACLPGVLPMVTRDSSSD